MRCITIRKYCRRQPTKSRPHGVTHSGFCCFFWKKNLNRKQKPLNGHSNFFWNFHGLFFWKYIQCPLTQIVFQKYQNHILLHLIFNLLWACFARKKRTAFCFYSPYGTLLICKFLIFNTLSVVQLWRISKVYPSNWITFLFYYLIIFLLYECYQ